MNGSNIKTGLTTDQVNASRDQYGSNTLELTENKVLFQVVKEVVLEPMFILLLAACLYQSKILISLMYSLRSLFFTYSLREMYWAV